MTLNLNALRTAQPLIEVGVKFVLRNVPHGSLWLRAAGRGLPPVCVVLSPASCQRLQPPGPSVPRSPDSLGPRPREAESPGLALSVFPTPPAPRPFAHRAPPACRRQGPPWAEPPD